MSSVPSPVWRAQHAWAEFARESLPKRQAKERTGDFKEIYSLYDAETAQRQARRCIQCPEPACRVGCPLSNRIPEWLGLVADGQFLEAAEISRSTSNMPEICSRVCPQECLCEGACILNARSEPVAIGAIERFISEYAFAHDACQPPLAKPNGCPVAVIGSGPGGLVCADELARRGYKVTIFEAQNIPGGLLVNGIPSFKLEKRIVERRLNVLRAEGIRFQTGVQIGRDLILEELHAHFRAIFLGFGAQKPKTLQVPGAQLTGVYPALPFLIQANVPRLGIAPISVRDKVVAVLGGGDTAMDCLRTAIRCGAARALCLYRRDLENMPGSRREYLNSVEEGAEFYFLTTPVSLAGNAKDEVTHIRCVLMDLGEPDAEGRRRPRPIPGAETLVPADIVLVAYGFDPVSFSNDNAFARLKLNDWGGIVVDEKYMTSTPGVFAGGDSVRGPSLVAHAVRDGRKAAAAMDRYLRETGG
jgi:glutamate synthase (NADPH) small chain